MPTAVVARASRKQARRDYLAQLQQCMYKQNNINKWMQHVCEGFTTLGEDSWRQRQQQGQGKRLQES